MIKASLRGLLHRKLRLTLAVVAIVLSVGFLAGSIVLGDTLNARFSGLFRTVNENVAVQVAPADNQAETPVRLTQADLASLKVDGVDKVSGTVEAEGVIPFRSDNGKAVTASPALAVGVGPEGDPLGLVEKRRGEWPVSSGDVAISANTARLAKVGLNDELKVFIPRLGESRTYRVSGIFGFAGGRDTLAGETLIMFQLDHAQKLFYGDSGLFAGASFSAAEGVSQQDLKKRIEAKLPNGFKATTGQEATEEASNAASDQFGAFTILLSAFAGIAAFVGVFLIYNTFNIIVAQRSRELALLRAMGAGWGQVIGAVLLEALIVGGFGATLGLATGIGVGAGAEAWLSDSLGFQLPSGGIVVSPWAVIWSYVVGVVVTMIAAFIPAIKASMVPPVAAMRDVVKPDKSLVGLSITGAAFAVPGAALLFMALAGIAGSLTTLLLAGGVGLIFIGVALLSPLLAKPVVRLIGALIGRGQAGKLGVRNALRNPRRTAVTAAALMIGVSLISLAATVAQSFKTSLNEILGADFGVEVMVQAPPTAPPTGEAGFNPQALEEVRRLPGVTEVAAWHITIESSLNGQPYPVLATDVAVAQRMWRMETASGEMRTLAAQEMVVDDKYAEAQRWTVGKKVDVGIGSTTKQYTVVGIYKATPTVQGPLLGLPAVDDFAGNLAYQGFVSVEPGTDVAATVAAAEKIMADYPGVLVGDMSSYVQQTGQAFDFLVNAITVLLGVALVIALLGIMNTLLLSIVERTRELGLVRAVGLSRGGVVRMVGVESILIAVFGCLLGVALGVGLAAAAVQALIDLEIMTTFALPWANLAGYVVVALIFGVVAALWPARRAAKLNVLEAIAYE